MFHVILRQAGPEYDPALPLEEQSRIEDHAAYMNQLVDEGHTVLGGMLPNLRVAHAIEAESEEEVRELWARDPWYGTHLILESVEPWDIRLDARDRS
jgi:uncharacterized protein YciI